jgi:hypothetical protein
MKRKVKRCAGNGVVGDKALSRVIAGFPNVVDEW